MNTAQIAIAIWLLTAAASVVVGFVIAARMKRKELHLLRAVSIAVPLAWAFAPAVGLGAQGLPTPAGMILSFFILDSVKGSLVNGRGFEVGLALFMFLISAVGLIGLIYVPRAVVSYLERMRSRKNA